MSQLSCWGPLTTLGTAAVAADGSATLTLDLEASCYQEALLGCQVIFGATAAADTTVSVYRGLSGGSLIDLVPALTLTATATADATAMLTTLIGDTPYAQIIVANGDATSAVDIVVWAQGHFEQGLDRLI